MADSGPGGGTIERVQAQPVERRRGKGGPAALVRPAGRVLALVALEVLQNPRARAAALRLTRSAAARLAGGRPSRPAAHGGGGVLVRRVEAVVVVIGPERPGAR